MTMTVGHLQTPHLSHPNGLDLLRLTPLIPQWLKGTQTMSVLFADSPSSFTPFLCLNSICSAGSRFDHEPWCLHNSFPGTALPHTYCWPRTMANIGAAPAHSLHMVIPS